MSFDICIKQNFQVNIALLYQLSWIQKSIRTPSLPASGLFFLETVHYRLKTMLVFFVIPGKFSGTKSSSKRP